ncbi:MAG: hypothetical protein RLZZ54_2233 [Cyanobacteriota bacterium]
MADAPAPTPDNEQQPEVLELGAETAPTAATAADPAPTAAAPAEAPAPEREPEPEPEPAAPEPPSATVAEVPAPVVIDTPTVASTIEVPAKAPVNPTPTEEGGEWDLLVQKLRNWIASGQLQQQWQAARTPLSLLAGLIAVLLVLRVYSAVLGVLDSIPLLSGLLELAGLVAVIQFSLTRLVRSEDRREVIGGLRQRWKSFRGRS